MRDLFYVVFFFCLLIPSLGIAQKDSIYTDTVLIVKPPLVIEKKVHVSLGTTEPMHLDKSFELGAYYSVLNNVAPSPSFTTSPFQSYGLKAKLGINNLNFTLGMGMLSSTIKYVPLDSFLTVTTTTTYQRETCFEQRLKDGSIIKKCTTVVITNIDVNSVKVEGDDHKTPIIRLQIPFTIGYFIKGEKWKLNPAFQLAYTYNIWPKSDFWQWRQTLWMIGPEISLSYDFSAHFATELRCEYKTTLSTFSKSDEFKKHFNLLGLGVGVNYKF